MLNVRSQKLGDATVLHCVGQITFPHAAVLRTLMLQEPHARRLVLDLSNVTGMDAAGLGMLVSLHSSATRSGGRFNLMNVTSKVGSLLELTNLKSIFEVCSAREMLDLLGRALHGPEVESAGAANSQSLNLCLNVTRPVGIRHI